MSAESLTRLADFHTSEQVSPVSPQQSLQQPGNRVPRGWAAPGGSQPGNTCCLPGLTAAPTHRSTCLPPTPTSSHMHVCMYNVSQQTNKPSFYHNFVKYSQIFIIYSRSQNNATVIQLTSSQMVRSCRKNAGRPNGEELEPWREAEMWTAMHNPEGDGHTWRSTCGHEKGRDVGQGLWTLTERNGSAGCHVLHMGRTKV